MRPKRRAIRGPAAPPGPSCKESKEAPASPCGVLVFQLELLARGEPFSQDDRPQIAAGATTRTGGRRRIFPVISGFLHSEPPEDLLGGGVIGSTLPLAQ
jgi:hypothetical protein